MPVRFFACALVTLLLLAANGQAAPPTKRLGAKQLLALLRLSLKRTSTVQELARELGYRVAPGQALPLITEDLLVTHPALVVPESNEAGQPSAVLRTRCRLLGRPCELRLALPGAAALSEAAREQQLLRPAVGVVLLLSAASSRNFPLRRIERILRGLDLGVYLSGQAAPCPAKVKGCHRRKYLVPALQQSRPAVLLLELQAPDGPVTAIQLLTIED